MLHGKGSWTDSMVFCLQDGSGKLFSRYYQLERNVLISQLPTLSTLYLETPPEKRRAYVILSFLAHGYIWGSASPIDV